MQQQDSAIQNVYDVHIGNGDVRSISARSMIEAEALRVGCKTVHRVNSSSTNSGRPTTKFSVITSSGSEVSFVGSRLGRTLTAAISAADNKSECKRILGLARLPVPRGKDFGSDEVDEALNYAATSGFPVVVKPISGAQGIGVATNVKSPAEFRQAFDAAVTCGFKDDRVIIEEHVEGRDFRIFATRRSSLSVIERRPAAVVGDGCSTISELIAEKNKLRQRNPYLKSKLIKPKKVTAMLAGQALSLASVLDSGKRVALSSVANISQGGESVELTQITHPSILDLARRAVEAIPGLEYAGVDILMQDPAKPAEAQPVVIIEVNATPDMLMHPFPAFGDPINVPALVVEEFVVEDTNQVTAARANDASLRVQLTITGNVTGVGYRRWFSRQAETLGLTARARNRGKQVEAYAEGSAYRVAMLIRTCAVGPKASDVKEVMCSPLDCSAKVRLIHSFGAETSSDIKTAPEEESPSLSVAEIISYIRDCRFDDFPHEVIARVKLLLLDCVGTIVLGASRPKPTATITLIAEQMSGRPEATVVGTELRCSSNMAAFANASLAQVFDFNDGHRVAEWARASGHPGRVIIPVALAEGERTQVDGKSLLAALVIGYDVACRIRGKNIGRTSNYYASAAIAARLRGLSRKQISAAMGLAGYAHPSKVCSAPGQYVNGLRARIGIEAAIAAAAGQEGASLEFDPELSLRFAPTRAASEFEVMNIYLKPYPTCRMTHSAIEALLRLKEEMGFSHDEIESIDVRQLPQGMYVVRGPKWTGRRNAFDLYYCLARAAIDGEINTSQFDKETMADSRVAEVAGKIEVKSENKLAHDFPAQNRPAVVTVTLRSGESRTLRIDRPRGDPMNFMSTGEVVQKFLLNTSHVLGEQRAAAAVDLILNIDKSGTVEDLMALLRLPTEKTEPTLPRFAQADA